MQYKFSGSPEAINAAAQAHTATQAANAQKFTASAQQASSAAGAQASIMSAAEQRRAAEVAAQAGVASSANQATGNIYGGYAGLLGTTGGNMAQMFDSYGRNSGSYFNAVANLGANAMSNAQGVNTGLFGAYAGGNQAHQNMLGNLGAASLAGYGQAANSAMQAQAMNSTAFAKAMSDAMASNQAAVSSYGTGRGQALAALGAGMGAAGGNIANAFAQNAASAGQMAGTGASAISNLGGTLGTAAGNLSGSQMQAQSALRAAMAQASGQLGSATGSNQAALRGNMGQSQASVQNAQAQGMASLGASGNAALSGLANPMANAASNDLNYTRDMAKLGLARELGLAGTNAMGSSTGGMPIGMSLSGPEGPIASGSAGGFGGGGQASFVDPYSNMPFYTQPQNSNQAGLQSLGNLQSGILGNTGNLAGGVQDFGQTALGMLGRQSDDGAQDISRTFDRSAGQIDRESVAGGRELRQAGRAGQGAIQRQGDQATSGILAALMQGGRQIDDSQMGIMGAGQRAFDGMSTSQNAIMSSGVLDQLASGYQGGMGQLQQAFQQGQRDPREIFGQVRGDIEALSSPFLQRGSGSMRDFYGNFPEGPAFGGVAGSALDPTPYLNELRSAYDPFIGNLNNAYGAGMTGLMNMADRGGTGFNQALGGLVTGEGFYDREAQSPMERALTPRTPAETLREAREAQLLRQQYSLEDRTKQLQRIINSPAPLPYGGSSPAAAAANQNNLAAHRARQQQAQHTLASLT
jgi:hypothetical protein